MKLKKVTLHPGLSNNDGKVHIADYDATYRADLHHKRRMEEPYGFVWVKALCGKRMFSPRWPKYPKVDCRGCINEYKKMKGNESSA